MIRGDIDAALLSRSLARTCPDSGDIKAQAIVGAPSDDPEIADAEDFGIPELGQLRIMRMLGGPPGLPLLLVTNSDSGGMR